MKKIVLCLSVLVSVCIFGQTPITITSQDAPAVGLQVLNVKNLSNLNSVTVGSANANETFDFSWFPNDNQDSIFYVTPLNTTLPSEFPNANLATLRLPDTLYSFFNTQTDLIEVVGLSLNIPGFASTIAANSTDPLLQLNIPVNYQDEFTDQGIFKTNSLPLNIGIPSEFFALLNLPVTPDTAWVDSIRTTITRNRFSIIDAWGTTQTPDGSFNTLRQAIFDSSTVLLEAHITAVVTIPFVGQQTIPLGFLEVPSTAVPFPIPGNDTTTTYNYYTNATSSHPSLIAQVVTNRLGMSTSAYYTKIYNPAGIIETTNNIVSELFPNPSMDLVNIKANDKIEILNVYAEDGQLIFNRNINSTNYSLNISSFKTGVYFVEINTAKGREVKRINKI